MMTSLVDAIRDSRCGKLRYDRSFSFSTVWSNCQDDGVIPFVQSEDVLALSVYSELPAIDTVDESVSLSCPDHTNIVDDDYNRLISISNEQLGETINCSPTASPQEARLFGLERRLRLQSMHDLELQFAQLSPRKEPVSSIAVDADLSLQQVGSTGNTFDMNVEALARESQDYWNQVRQHGKQNLNDFSQTKATVPPSDSVDLVPSNHLVVFSKLPKSISSTLSPTNVPSASELRPHIKRQLQEDHLQYSTEAFLKTTSTVSVQSTINITANASNVPIRGNVPLAVVDDVSVPSTLIHVASSSANVVSGPTRSVPIDPKSMTTATSTMVACTATSSSSKMVGTTAPNSLTMIGTSTSSSSTIAGTSIPSSSTIARTSIPSSSTMVGTTAPNSLTMIGTSTPSSSTIAGTSTPSMRSQEGFREGCRSPKPKPTELTGPTKEATTTTIPSHNDLHEKRLSAIGLPKTTISNSSNTAPSKIEIAKPKKVASSPTDTTMLILSKQLEDSIDLLKLTRNMVNKYIASKQQSSSRQNSQMLIMSAINSCNATNVDEKLSKVNKLIHEQTSNRAKLFCINFFAEKLVIHSKKYLQQLNQVHCRDLAAYARLAVGVAVVEADFKRILLAHIYVACHTLVPYYHPDGPQMDLNTVRGIARLFGALFVCSVPGGPEVKRGSNNPFCLRMVWTWLADVINLQLSTPEIVVALFEVLNICGFALHEVYGKMFDKLKRTLKTEYWNLIIQNMDASQYTRLQVLLEKRTFTRFDEFGDKSVYNVSFD